MMKREIINTPEAPAAVGPYVQGIKTGDTVYVSGQLGIDVAAGKMPASLEEQAHCSMRNLGAILEAAGSCYDQIVKTTIFLQDMNDFAAMNEVYAGYFSAPFPARAAFEVAKLPKGAKVEIEAVAKR